MYFIALKKLPSGNMKSFNFSPEFEKDFRQLLKKYRTLEDDFEKFKEILAKYPTGVGKNFTIIHSEQICKIVKARMACRVLRDRSLRVIYAYAEKEEKFDFIELYCKGEQVNEDKGRINVFLRRLKTNG